MEYTKLLLVLCLFVVLIKAIPLPPADPAAFLEENGLEAPEDQAPEEDIPEAMPEEEQFPEAQEEQAQEEQAPELPQTQEEQAPELPETPEQAPVFDAQEEQAPEQAQEEQQIEEVSGAPVQQDEPIYVDPEADQEPQDISTDTNGVVADNIGNITNDILGGVSYAIKTALEQELGTEANDSATNGIVNNVVVDLLNKTADEIKTAVSGILENDIENTDFQTIAAEAAGKVGEALGNNVVTSIASNININLDYENVAKNVINTTVGNVEEFVKKNLETSKAVVDQTLTNESSDDLAISNANDIATMVTNGVSYLLKSTLCESLNDQAETCDNIVNSIIIGSAGILNEIVSSNIKAAPENGLIVSCAAIPGEIFEKLTAVVVDAVSAQLGATDADNVSKIANSVLTLIINSLEDLLCADRTDADEEGSIILKDITGLATHIINKVNNINENVVSNLNEGNEENSTSISGTITTGITDIQETLKEEVSGESKPAEEQPANEEANVEQPAEEQPANEEANVEQPAEAEQANDEAEQADVEDEAEN